MLLISGSLAYDYIMDFPGRFSDHIMPDHIHILNVSFVVDTLKKNYGGTAGNIAYTAALLGDTPIILGALGTDGDEYLEYLQKNNINTHYIFKSKILFTSSAHITTDKDDNQITAFYPGAGNDATKTHVHNVKEKVSLVLISPSGQESMIQHARSAKEYKIPYVFDPGQQITALNKEDIKELILNAWAVIGNDYEMKLIEKKSGMTVDTMLTHAKIIITTLGEKGSVIQTKDKNIKIPACKPQQVIDPTGAGDAYRAGFFVAYTQGKDLKTCGQTGAVAASFAIEQYGTQKHNFSQKEFQQRFNKTFGI